ncbi:MAG: type II toxin-antitoxin system VapC family toxin [Chloroflexota bacterium]
MNVVDSSGWIEYFADGPNADFFEPVITQTSKLIVPSFVIHEVFRWVLQQKGEDEALLCIALMTLGKVVDLTMTIAVNAAELSTRLDIPSADSLVLTTALSHNATLWTQDSDFKDLPGVRYVERRIDF